MSRGRLSAASAALALLGQLACADANSTEARGRALDEVRAATEKYRDVKAALADGYMPDPLNICETPYHMGSTTQSGVMGIHYLHPELLGIGEQRTRLDATGAHTDFTHPAVLVYEPQTDGSLELVALENLVSADAWEAGGNRGPPSFAGQPYAFTPENPAMTLPALFDLHVWLYRDNPSGMFEPYNPNATCEHHVYEMPMMHPPAHAAPHSQP